MPIVTRIQRLLMLAVRYAKDVGALLSRLSHVRALASP